MGRGLICDNCGGVLHVNHHGEDEAGESAAWIKLAIASLTLDACTRSCAHELLDDEDVVATHNAYLETITEIATLIRDGDA